VWHRRRLGEGTFDFRFLAAAELGTRLIVQREKQHSIKSENTSLDSQWGFYVKRHSENGPLRRAGFPGKISRRGRRGCEPIADGAMSRRA